MSVPKKPNPKSKKQIADIGKVMTENMKRGALCKICKKRMLECDGCIVKFYILSDGRRLPPVPFADAREGYAEMGMPTPAGEERCHDCGAKPGQPHHPGCDVERCAACPRQALMCEHMDSAQIGVAKLT